MALRLMVNQVSRTGDDLAHRRVQAIHGTNGEMVWQHTQEQAIENIAKKLFSYYLFENGRAVRLIVGRTAASETFLKAETDDDFPAQLLNLPSILPTKT